MAAHWPSLWCRLPLKAAINPYDTQATLENGQPVASIARDPRLIARNRRENAWFARICADRRELLVRNRPTCTLHPTSLRRLPPVPLLSSVMVAFGQLRRFCFIHQLNITSIAKVEIFFSRVELNVNSIPARNQWGCWTLVNWCFELCQPPGIISGLRETFIKRHVVERTNKAEIRLEEQSEKNGELSGEFME